MCVMQQVCEFVELVNNWTHADDLDMKLIYSSNALESLMSLYGDIKLYWFE